MQELQFVPDDSDAASLVLRAPDSDEMYWIPVTDELRAALSAVAGQAAAPDEPAQPAASPDTDDATEDHAEVAEVRMTLRPRDIQKRLRHGATVAELAAETGMPESRLLPYAHPIEMERHRIADLARQAYPVRADGPADQPLRDVLATAFSARGEDVNASEWDAAMDGSDHWIISVRWTRGNRQGATEFIAEFRWVPAAYPGQGPATVEPVNSVAGDLIDPRFNRPVRSVSPGATVSAAGVDSTGGGSVGSGDPSGADASGADTSGTDVSVTDVRPAAPELDIFGDPIAQPDEGQSHPSKRRRGTTTPHWEDVLLGVRTSPRRKK